MHTAFFLKERKINIKNVWNSSVSESKNAADSYISRCCPDLCPRHAGKITGNTAAVLSQGSGCSGLGSEQ